MVEDRHRVPRQRIERVDRLDRHPRLGCPQIVDDDLWTVEHRRMAGVPVVHRDDLHTPAAQTLDELRRPVRALRPEAGQEQQGRRGALVVGAGPGGGR